MVDYSQEKTQDIASSNHVLDLDEEYSNDEAPDYSTVYVDEYNPKGLRKPTAQEKQTLRRVIVNLPWICYLLCLAELAERASYYSVQGILSNFIQRPLPPGSTTGKVMPGPGSDDISPGALGMGLPTTQAMTNLLAFLAYVVPLYGGYLADTKLGKFKAIWVGILAGLVSHILFVIAAIPLVIKQGHGIVPLAFAIITLAFGTGFIKPNLLPLLLDQYKEKHDVVKVLPSGELVIVDREKTLERITLYYYWSINIGAFFQLATSYIERRIGFWFAFFIPIIIYLILPVVFWYLKSKLIDAPPAGSVLTNASKILRVSYRRGWIKRLKNGTFWDYATPTEMEKRGETYFKEKPSFISRAYNKLRGKSLESPVPITWDDQWVLNVRQTIDSCKIFCYYPVYLLNDSGLGSVQTSQAGSMTLNGVPNDLFNNFNPLTIIVLIPILDLVVYPAMRRYKINFRPVYRITFGFFVASMAQVAGAVLQHKIYQTSPCGDHATNCELGVSPISAWQEVSLYVLQAASECFAMTTSYEIAYTRAPPNSKGLVMALCLFASAISSALSLAITPALYDPNIIWAFVAMACVGIFFTILFFIHFRNLHVQMEKERIWRESLDHEDRLASFKAAETGEVTTNFSNLEAVTSLRAQGK
jgi:dipeptide/tripeptide permease